MSLFRRLRLAFLQPASAAGVLLGRRSASAGEWEEVSPSNGIAISGTSIAVSGTVSGITLTNYTEQLTNTTTSGNITISLADGPLQRITLDAARTINMPADPGAVGSSFTLIVRCQGFAVTWGTSPAITWIDPSGSGSAPTLNTASGKQNVVTFVWDDNAAGTGTWLGFFGGRAA